MEFNMISLSESLQELKFPTTSVRQANAIIFTYFCFTYVFVPLCDKIRQFSRFGKFCGLQFHCIGMFLCSPLTRGV